MARYLEACRHILGGRSPLQTADAMGISLGSVRQYLCLGIGEGALRASDIAFSIDERTSIEAALGQSDHSSASTGKRERSRIIGHVRKLISTQGRTIDRELIELYLMVRDPRPDLYALICEAEIALHRFVRRTLEQAYQSRWWQDGIPLRIRQTCQSRREEDHTPLDAYHYTTFVDLKEIIDKKWTTFAAVLPKSLSKNKAELLDSFQTMNEIRNRVMHPVKMVPEYEQDYLFARAFLESVRMVTNGVEPTPQGVGS
jgi:hypothetical protein